jgi:peptidoglycan/xylan/chitin deacetylase (PgdA/CDA1 family)
MVQAEYMAGHQLSVHTWSHPYLTKLTNEEIVAELGWTKQVIKDVVGVTPNTFRPPYGDIDDRVRAIAAQMGLTPVIWSSVTANGTTTNFDTVSYALPKFAIKLTRYRPTGTSPEVLLLVNHRSLNSTLY